MADLGSEDFFVPFPYGAPPSSGVPSTSFWDLLNNQTSAGQKTVTDAFAFAKTAQAATAEVIFTATVSDDANALYGLSNATSAASTFIPLIRHIGNNVTSTSNLAQYLYQLGAAQDTGTVAMQGEVYRNSAGGQVGARDLWSKTNGSTVVLSQNFRGALTLTQLNFAGAREVYFTINQVGLTSNGFIFDNQTATDSELAPRLRFLGTSTQPGWLDFTSPTDTGTNPIARYNAMIGAGAAATRPTHAWANNGTDQADLTAGGSFRVKQAGQGLRVAEGSNAKQGTAVLVGGTVTVANTSVTANSRIFLTSQVDGGTPGFVRVSARVASTSFTITSSSGTDTSTIAYEIFEPA